MEPPVELLLRMGDNALVLGHRVSEWCGHAPVLEEDIALANVALDLIGQAQLWLGLAGELEGAGRSADDLAFLRDVWDFRNLLLVEQPNGDFGQTLMRQYLFDAWHVLQLQALTESTEARVGEIAEKALKEARYHLERSRSLVIGLGDGTPESHARMQGAVNRLWPYAGEMFLVDPIDEALIASGIAPLPRGLWANYHAEIQEIFSDATLTVPESGFAQRGGRSGERHSEHLGPMLAQMQWLQRAYPGATW
ncbi:MAG: 1,2-phenylacetyl-CoA epoxidase subunit PaaC [Pseudomonadota bacterium]